MLKGRPDILLQSDSQTRKLSSLQNGGVHISTLGRIVIRLLIVALMSLHLIACVSSGEDYAIAAAVGKYLDTAGVVPLDTREADRTHSGKIVYFAPGINGSPNFTYYEVTDPADMEKLKKAAEVALREVPASRKITLHFMEKQVFHQSANGSGYRGHENEINTIVVQRDG